MIDEEAFNPMKVQEIIFVVEEDPERAVTMHELSDIPYLRRAIRFKSKRTI